MEPTLFVMELVCLGLRYPVSSKDVRYPFILPIGLWEVWLQKECLNPSSEAYIIAMTDVSCQHG